MKQRTITVRIICLALLICLLVPAAAGCKKGTSDLKIGVLWEDDTSGESAAWAKYLRSLAKEYGFTVDFTTTNSSSSEVSAINTYASKGYRAILLLSDDDIVTSVTAAAVSSQELSIANIFIKELKPLCHNKRVLARVTVKAFPPPLFLKARFFVKGYGGAV